jgi:hypothetical protein
VAAFDPEPRGASRSPVGFIQGLGLQVTSLIGTRSRTETSLSPPDPTRSNVDLPPPCDEDGLAHPALPSLPS